MDRTSLSNTFYRSIGLKSEEIGAQVNNVNSPQTVSEQCLQTSAIREHCLHEGVNLVCSSV